MECSERRQYTRFSLCAYGCDKACTVELGGSRLTADLVDISAGGARLKLSAPLPELTGKELVFSVDSAPGGALLQKIPAEIRWRKGQEIGIKFGKELVIGLSDLQRLVC